MTRRPWTRAALVLPAAAAVLTGAGGTAYALAQARATAAQGVATVATYGAQAQPDSGAVQPGPLTYSYTVVSDQSVKTFVVRNTGTLAQSAQSWEVLLTNTGAGTKGDATITTCLTPFTALGTCSNALEQPQTVGTVTNAGTTAPDVLYKFTTGIPLAPQAVFYARFTPNKIRVYNVSFTMTVSRGQATPASSSTTTA